jgi:phosphatidylserine/phosphatidylglycerophosphate/cardiolipin synthase-like enzyme
MRFKSRKTDGYIIYAVSGVNTISFAIDFEQANTKGLLGFAIELHDLTNNESYFINGFKVFKERIPNPDENTIVSTFDNPIQSFVWDDFTGKENTKYRYIFYPLKGSPKNINRSAKPIEISVQTEALFNNKDTHDVFFNRGVASSQAFARRFGNKIPDKVTDPERKGEVFEWLARDLKKGMIAFIEQAGEDDTILACFYEFRFEPIVEVFKNAIKNKKANVKIIIDAKINQENFPRDDNIKTTNKIGIPKSNIILREARRSSIQHNKFMVLLQGKLQKPVAVWTGSTNISEGGIFGQTNVGHWVRDEETAKKFKTYWDILSKDPGGKSEDLLQEKKEKNKAFKKEVMQLQEDIIPDNLKNLPKGITTIFSPRTTNTMLKTYAALLDSAQDYAAITLAFGISDVFREILADNTTKDQITFMLLEKKDMPKEGNDDEFTYLRAGNNVYQASGSYIKDPLYSWTKEINAAILKLNKHVLYIHSKFLLVDPLGANPIVITGSANFSEASTVENDENMLLIKGNRRVADIYFTEFNRLFNHYYFRSLYEKLRKGTDSKENSLFLVPDDSWLSKYKKGTLRYKRLMTFRKIDPD